MTLRSETTRRIGKTWRVAIWLLGVVMIASAVSRPAPIDARESGAQSVTAVPAHRETIKQYCETCHNSKLKTGGLVLDTLDLGQVGHDKEVWERVVRKLRAGAMPPYGTRRPDEATMARLVGWLEGELDKSGSSHPGRPVLRRLNRAEYANAIRDLLGIEVNVAALLPPDDAAFGFDNVADAQSSSPALLQAYLAAARKISAVAIGDPAMDVGSDTYSVRQDLSQDVYLEGLPLGTVGGLRVTHAFPVDAEYDFQIRLYRTNLNAIRGLEDPQEVELTLDGERIHTAQIGGDADLMAAQLNPTDTSDAIEATRLRVRLFVTAGQHDIAAAFLEKTSPTFETHRLRRFIRDFANPYDAEGAPHVQSITIQGPYQTTGVSEAVSSRLFVCRPANDNEQSACARRIVSSLAHRAYRRPPSAAEIDVLMSFYERGRSRGSFGDGVRLSLRRILASPSFVYRPEAEPRQAAQGTVYPITDLELATRLSFFLWSSIPDEQLLRVGESGELSKPDVLAAQVRRMLADPKAEAFVNNFAGKWLQLRNLRGLIPNSDMFPDFDDNLRDAFEREAQLFFKSIIDEDRSVLDLMTADYTFVNDRLARHYGIPNIVGGYFRRVPLKEDVRRGLLGKGAVLMVTSHANTTSPVLRGKWVLENILGAPPPSPPADLDTALKDEGPGAPPRTMREQMEMHRRSPLCATCHRVMDPIGFALENFDVVGAWRTKNEAGLPLNTADALVDGTKITDAVTLRTALLKRPDVFVQTLTEKLLVYALGRGLTPEDMPGVRAIVRQASQNNYRFSSIVEGIVNGAPFRMRMKIGAEAPGGQVASRR
jgi:mono/diheme cytochrome c family protein